MTVTSRSRRRRPWSYLRRRRRRRRRCDVSREWRCRQRIFRPRAALNVDCVLGLNLSAYETLLRTQLPERAVR